MPKRVGRPAKKRSDDERVPFAVRVRGEIYNQLIEAADKNDRPLASQAELMVEQALIIEKVMGKTGLRPMIEIMTSFVRSGEHYAEENGVTGDWTEDPQLYLAAARSAFRHLLKLSPPPWDGQGWHDSFDQILVY